MAEAVFRVVGFLCVVGVLVFLGFVILSLLRLPKGLPHSFYEPLRRRERRRWVRAPRTKGHSRGDRNA